MLQNEYLLAKIGADIAENERNFAESLPKIGNYPPRTTLRRGTPSAAKRLRSAVTRARRDAPARKVRMRAAPRVFSQDGPLSRSREMRFEPFLVWTVCRCQSVSFDLHWDNIGYLSHFRRILHEIVLKCSEIDSPPHSNTCFCIPTSYFECLLLHKETVERGQVTRRGEFGQLISDVEQVVVHHS